DSFFADMPEYCVTRVPLSPHDLDPIMSDLVSGHGWNGQSMPRDLASFYKRFDGMTIDSDRGICNLRPLGKTEKIGRPSYLVRPDGIVIDELGKKAHFPPKPGKEESRLQDCAPEWLVVCDLPDGTFVAVELKAPDTSDNSWRVCRFQKGSIE